MQKISNPRASGFSQGSVEPSLTRPLLLIGCPPARPPPPIGQAQRHLFPGPGWASRGQNLEQQEEEEGSCEDCERPDPGSKLLGESLEARLAGVAHL